MMASFGHGTRRHPRTRGRMGSQWGSPRASRFEVGGGPDRATLGIIGLVCAVAGFFVLGIVLGPVAIVCGWLAMGRSWAGSRSVPAVVADPRRAGLLRAGAAGWGNGLFWPRGIHGGAPGTSAGGPGGAGTGGGGWSFGLGRHTWGVPLCLSSSESRGSRFVEGSVAEH